MEIIDVGNINGDSFYVEFDKKSSLEDAAKILAEEYVKATGCLNIFCNGPLNKGQYEVYHFGRNDNLPELELSPLNIAISEAFQVKKGESFELFGLLHSNLKNKYLSQK